MIDPNCQVKVGDRVRFALNPDLHLGTVTAITGDPLEPFEVRWDDEVYEGEFIANYDHESLIWIG